MALFKEEFLQNRRARTLQDTLTFRVRFGDDDEHFKVDDDKANDLPQHAFAHKNNTRKWFWWVVRLFVWISIGLHNKLLILG